MLALGVALASNPVCAANYTWTAGVSGDYGNGANWSGGVAPWNSDNISVDVALGDPGPLISSGGNFVVLNVIVGNNGTGTLDLDAGGSLGSAQVTIGYNAGSLGTITVNSTNSNWLINGALVVGERGEGILNIENGGAVFTTGNVLVGDIGPQGKGTIFVDDIDSKLTVGGSLLIGNDGGTTGKVTISHGATASVQDVIIGNASGGVGTMQISSTAILSANTVTVGRLGQGTLTLGYEGGAVNVLNNGTLYIAQLAGSIGTLNIGAAAGHTAQDAGTLTAGTIQFGNGSGQIVFNHTTANYVFGTDITDIYGHGSIRQIAGTTILTGDSSGFTGTTTVEGGMLSVNGKLGGALDVFATGRLQGSGTVGNTSVSGTIAPGNSIGTLNVAGNVLFNAGSIYEVEVNAAGQSDRINATGTATINGGTVKVLAGAGNYAPSTQYTILTANGGVAGTFTGVTSNLAFLDPTLTYDPTNIYLTLTRNAVSFQNVGVTRNQIATGSGVESVGFGSPLYNAVLNLSAGQAQYAFDQLSGEIHASARTALIEDSRFLRNAVNDRIRAAFDSVGASSGAVVTYDDGEPRAVAATTDRLAVWGRGFGSWGHTNGDGNAARLNRSTGGFFIGADAPVFDTWRLGAVSGYSRTEFNVRDRHSSGTSDNYHVGLYGGTQWGNLAFRTGAAYTWHDLSTSRSAVFPGYADSLKGGYNASTAQAFGELGYGVRAGNVAFEPFANLAYVSLRTDSFTERGAAAALSGASATTDATFTTLGLRASTAFAMGGINATARGMLGWRHAFGDVTPLAAMTFAGGSVFTVGGVPIARNAAVGEAGLDFALTRAATFGVSYGGQFGSGVSDQSVKANFNMKF